MVSCFGVMPPMAAKIFGRDGVARVVEDALAPQVGRVVDLEADAHLLERADVAPAEDGEALLLELLVEVVLHRVARGVELVPAREEARQLEEQDVGDAGLREAERA